VLLVHLAADSLIAERRADEPRFCGTAESLAMEVIANNLFNDRDDNGDLWSVRKMARVASKPCHLDQERLKECGARLSARSRPPGAR
jgi:hypothetical protein